MVNEESIQFDDIIQSLRERDEPKRIAAELIALGMPWEESAAVGVHIANWLQTRDIMAFRAAAGMMQDMTPPPQTYLQLAAELGLLILAGQDFSVNNKRARKKQVVSWAVATVLMFKAAFPNKTYKDVVGNTRLLVNDEFGIPLSSLLDMMNRIPAKQKKSND